MSDSLREWVEESVKHETWAPQDLYRVALGLGYTDRRAVYYGIALLEAAGRVSRSHPLVPFDDVCEGLARGLIGQPELFSALLRVRLRLVIGYWWTRFRHGIRRR